MHGRWGKSPRTVRRQGKESPIGWEGLKADYGPSLQKYNRVTQFFMGRGTRRGEVGPKAYCRLTGVLYRGGKKGSQYHLGKRELGGGNL